MIGYHGTRSLYAVLQDGLVPVAPTLGCQIGHVCIAETAGIAANFGLVLEVQLSGLDVPDEGFVGGEMRMHSVVPPDRLRMLDPQPEPDWVGFVDPATGVAMQHPTCERLA